LFIPTEPTEPPRRSLSLRNEGSHKIAETGIDSEPDATTRKVENGVVPNLIPGVGCPFVVELAACLKIGPSLQVPPRMRPTVDQLTQPTSLLCLGSQDCSRPQWRVETLDGTRGKTRPADAIHSVVTGTYRQISGCTTDPLRRVFHLHKGDSTGFDLGLGASAALWHENPSRHGQKIVLAKLQYSSILYERQEMNFESIRLESAERTLKAITSRDPELISIDRHNPVHAAAVCFTCERRCNLRLFKGTFVARPSQVRNLFRQSGQDLWCRVRRAVIDDEEISDPSATVVVNVDSENVRFVANHHECGDTHRNESTTDDVRAFATAQK
jgi:hypothetical protein